METKDVTIGVVGVGSMGSAIAGGLVGSGTCAAQHVVVCDANPACTEKMAALGMRVASTAAELVAQNTDVVVLAVKPQILADVCSGFAENVANRLVVSIAAGVAIETLEGLLQGARVVRVMPNLPIQVRSGATAVCAGTRATAEDVQLVCELFSALGSAQVMREDQLDAEGAVVSCGPAYVALFIDALTRAGILRGLPADSCREMVEATVLGVAKTLVETGEHPRSYLERVTSPGGTTAAGLREMEPYVMEAAYAAVDAALARTAELAGSK
ncbi:MAG: pyrroline-5-carboxylate reductase [Atopobiaceae bacterium]|nr:pyrroline-5-carboxylate reductase [Atopobiaceae bacterium]